MGTIRSIIWSGLLLFSLAAHAQVTEPDSTGIAGDSLALDSLGDGLSLQEKLDQLNPDGDLSIAFMRPNQSHSPDSSYFNIVKIDNNTGSPISGKVKIIGPDNWNIVYSISGSTTVQPGQPLYIPFRISLPAETYGGLSYILNAYFELDDKKYTGIDFVRTPVKSNWKLIMDKGLAYQTKTDEFTPMQFKLKNDGNTTELIRVQLEIGKLLKVSGFNKDLNFKYIEIPPQTDTTITWYVMPNTDMDPDLADRYKNSWKATSINLEVGNTEKKEYRSFRVIALESEYTNERPTSKFPLNISGRFSNLIFVKRPRLRLNVWGTVELKRQRELYYRFYSIWNFNKLDQWNYNQNAFLYLVYRSPKLTLTYGDRLNTGKLHSVNGRGINAYYKLLKNHHIEAGYVSYPLAPIQGFSAFYNGFYKNGITARAGIILETNEVFRYNAQSLQLGGKLRVLKYNHVFLDVLFTQADFNNMNTFPGINTSQSDTSVLGYAYNLGYAFGFRKFSFSINNLNHTNNYIMNSGSNQIRIRSMYKFTKKVLLELNYNLRRQNQTRYPLRFFRPTDYYNYDYGLLTIQMPLGDRTISRIGPSYVGSVNNRYNTLRQTETRNSLYNPGIYGLMRYRLDEFKSVSLNFNAGAYQVQVASNDTLFPNWTSNWEPTYRVGINYYGKHLRVLAYYSKNPTFRLVYDPLADEPYDLSPNQIIQIRPAYQRFFFNNFIKLTTYLNYMYMLPARRVATGVYLRGDLYLPNYWSFNAAANWQSTSWNREGSGTVTTNGLTMLFGFKKSFDWQQPRMKYYDIDVVCFKDVNGNGMKDENENVLPNILIHFERNTEIPDVDKVYFASKDLCTSPEGMVEYNKIAEGTYDISIIPMENLQDIFPRYGNEQKIIITSNTTYYIPFIESFKSVGKVMVERDENFSNHDNLELKGIKITATNSNNEEFATFTDDYGNYTLTIPQSGVFQVKCHNTLGPDFEIENDEYIIDFSQNAVYNIDFVFKEKDRGINTSGNQVYQFKSFGAGNDEPKAEPEKTQDPAAGSGGGVSPELEKLIKDQQELIQALSDRLKNLEEKTAQQQSAPAQVAAPNAFQNGRRQTDIPDNILNEETEFDPQKLGYRVDLGEFTNDVPADILNKLIRLGYKEDNEPIDGKVRYLSEKFRQLPNAESYRDDMIDEGFKDPDPKIVADYDGKIISLEEAERLKRQDEERRRQQAEQRRAQQARSNATPAQATQAPATTNNQTTDGESLESLADMSDYEDLNNLIDELIDQNEGPQEIDNRQEFDQVDDLIDDLLLKTNPDAPNNGIESIDKKKISYRLELGVFEANLNPDQLKKLEELGYVSKGASKNDPPVAFLSNTFSDISLAEKYQKELEAAGFGKPRIVGDYDGVLITVKEAQMLINAGN
ncbi:TonB-dependent receptor [bacterium SCSIO 12741]|nr:TonB-dependent receptor [bacterium SCSIO 12741]